MKSQRCWGDTRARRNRPFRPRGSQAAREADPAKDALESRYARSQLRFQCLQRVVSPRWGPGQHADVGIRFREACLPNGRDESGHDVSPRRFQRPLRVESGRQAPSPASPVDGGYALPNLPRMFADAVASWASKSPLITIARIVLSAASTWSRSGHSMTNLPFCNSICWRP